MPPSNPFADWGRSVPVVSAPMAGAADAALAIAVSRAGALGGIGIGSTRGPEWIRAQLDALAAADVPFCIGLMAWSLPADDTAFALALAARPALLSISLGDLHPWIDRAKEAGITVAVQIGTAAEALAAERSGADMIVARGAEAGGHGRDAVATLPLLQQVLDTVAVPVLAAGGIATARGLAAVLAAGAAGAWVGTAFVGCVEATAGPAVRAALEAADGSHTVYTRAFDIAQRLPWPARYGGRALANDFTARWGGHDEALAGRIADEEPDAGITAAMRAARAAGDPATAPVYAGQGVGQIRVGVPAAAVIAEFARAPGLVRRAGHDVIDR